MSLVCCQCQRLRTRPQRVAVPRASDGKPDLTGVWQGGSTRRGTWEEANTGFGVGGTGTDPTAPAAPSSNDRPAGREGAPYQPWAAQKVLESYNKRAIDDPTSRCLPSGIPRIVMLGLFPQQIIQTPKQIVMLYEYMNVFRVIPLNAKHPDDLIPAYMGNSVGALGRRHAGGGRDRLQRQDLAVRHRDISLRRAAYHRAIHPRRQGPDQLRRDHGGSQGVNQAVDRCIRP